MSTITLFFIMVLICTTAMFLERAASWLAHISGLSIIILSALILSSLGVIPHQSALYNFFTGKAVLAGMALVLFSFNFKDLIALPKRILLIYIIGIAGTIVGGLFAIWLGITFLSSDAIKLGGQLISSYIGGAENDVAIKQALNVPDNLFTSVFAIDNILTSIWMVFTLLLAGRPKLSNEEENDINFITEDDKVNAANVFSILFSMLAASFVLIIANYIYDYTQFISPVLYLTILALGIGQIPQFRKWLAPSYRMGCVLFIFFFFAIGAISNITVIANLPIAVMLMPIIVLSIHGLVIFSSAWLLNIPFLETSVTSQALIGGPSTALAFAQAKNWKQGIPIAMVLGLLGYCIANFIGIITYEILMLLYG